jgi:hypothetical protein
MSESCIREHSSHVIAVGMASCPSCLACLEQVQSGSEQLMLLRFRVLQVHAVRRKCIPSA